LHFLNLFRFNLSLALFNMMLPGSMKRFKVVMVSRELPESLTVISNTKMAMSMVLINL
jgi:hypothetical protein